MGPVLNIFDLPVEKIDLRISPTVVRVHVSFVLNTIGKTCFWKNDNIFLAKRKRSVTVCTSRLAYSLAKYSKNSRANSCCTIFFQTIVDFDSPDFLLY